MAAEALHCPACGAPAGNNATRCEYCTAPLAIVACPKCMGRMFVGAKFCSHCGASAARTEVADAEVRLCPRCQVNMKAIVLGSIALRECPQCEGAWTDVETLQHICTEQEQQAAVLGLWAPSAEPAGPEKNIRYVPCPECHKLMNRVNFAGCSHVVVDVCKPHGTWFDKDELRRTVEFIRGGGLEKARTTQITHMEEERRRLESAKSTALAFELGSSSHSQRDVQGGLLADLLHSLLD